ncbi:hypothetical protein RFI_11134, partial [Reticulomyxa filosa]
MPLLIGKKMKDLTSKTSNPWQNEEIEKLEKELMLRNDLITEKSVIVLQNECASISTLVAKQYDSIGSVFATTCNIIFFVLNQSTKKIMCVHLDEGVKSDKKCMETLLTKHFSAKEREGGEIGMYIVGGYMDEKNTSQQVTQEILKQLINTSPEKCN